MCGHYREDVRTRIRKRGTAIRLHFERSCQCISTLAFAYVFPHVPDRPPSTPIMNE
jgi:hypothetical protein